MTDLSAINHFGESVATAIGQHLSDGALFVLIGRGPGIHSIVDRSGEVWTSETPVLGVMLRYLRRDRAMAIYERHCTEYGSRQRPDILLNAFYDDNHPPSRN